MSRDSREFGRDVPDRSGLQKVCAKKACASFFRHLDLFWNCNFLKDRIAGGTRFGLVRLRLVHGTVRAVPFGSDGSSLERDFLFQYCFNRKGQVHVPVSSGIF